MYFLNQARTLCHVLEDFKTGEAPDPCGARVNRIYILRYRQGVTSFIKREKPDDIPLCKHCEKALGLSRGA
jgi:hypothetical protein